MDLVKELWNIVEPMLIPSCDCWKYEMVVKTPAGGFWGYVRSANDVQADDKWKFHWGYCPICGAKSTNEDIDL